MEDKLIDLHTHTTASDGEYSPNDLIEKAIKQNVGTIAITDHDTINGIKQIDRNDPLIVDSKIKIINGIEMSAKVYKGQMHILGLDIDINNNELNNKMADLKQKSVSQVLNILQQIKKDYNITFPDEDIKQLINADRNIGRPDIAKLCIQYGYVTTVQEAFDKYLAPAYEKIRSIGKGLPYEECINIINSSHGIPVLAHPKSLKLEEKEFLILLKEMIACGLQGIEVYHSTHTKEEMNYYLNIAKEYNLLVSGGSDFHGEICKPDIELGTGRNNNLKIRKLSVLDRINNKF